MVCKNCGTHLNNEATVCHNCGIEINRNVRKMKVVKQQKQNPPAMSLLQYVYVLVVTLIPVLGIVMMFVWSFGKKDNPNRKNLARALLIVWVAVIIIFIILSLIFNKIIAEFIINYFSLF